jgi:chloride channel 3/4/5
VSRSFSPFASSSCIISHNQNLDPTHAGAGIGINAAVISIVTEWLSDIKMGYCSDGWWLNQQFCCWELDGDEESGCDSWHLWSTVSVARWFIYVLFAVRPSFPCFFL